MKIYGPYKCKDNRLRCAIKFIDGTMSSVSYPRLVYENHFNIKLSKYQDIHHKDGNPLNNSIDNLKVVEWTNHAFEHSKFELKVEKCVWCNSLFTLDMFQQRTRRCNIKRNKNGPFCSRKCTGQYGAFMQNLAT